MISKEAPTHPWIESAKTYEQSTLRQSKLVRAFRGPILSALGILRSDKFARREEQYSPSAMDFNTMKQARTHLYDNIAGQARKASDIIENSKTSFENEYAKLNETSIKYKKYLKQFNPRLDQIIERYQIAVEQKKGRLADHILKEWKLTGGLIEKYEKGLASIEKRMQQMRMRETYLDKEAKDLENLYNTYENLLEGEKQADEDYTSDFPSYVPPESRVDSNQIEELKDEAPAGEYVKYWNEFARDKDLYGFGSPKTEAHEKVMRKSIYLEDFEATIRKAHIEDGNVESGAQEFNKHWLDFLRLHNKI